MKKMLSESDISYVCDLAEEAGRLAADMRSTTTVRNKSTSDPLDFVTESDTLLSHLIVKRLQSRFSNDLVVSEEAMEVPSNPSTTDRIWFVDPIDGTENYVANDGHYSVMIGLVMNGKPAFGWISAPATGETYFGGPSYGAFRRSNGISSSMPKSHNIREDRPLRLMMGSRDRMKNDWLDGLSNIEWVHSGSVGLRVARIMYDEADAYIHLARKLKVWDTAGPVALALGGGLEISYLGDAELSYCLDRLEHASCLVIGRPGSGDWSRKFIHPNVSSTFSS